MALAEDTAATAAAMATGEDTQERGPKPLVERQKDAAKAIMREAVLTNYFGVGRCLVLDRPASRPCGVGLDY